MPFTFKALFNHPQLKTAGSAFPAQLIQDPWHQDIISQGKEKEKGLKRSRIQHYLQQSDTQYLYSKHNI